MTILLVGGGSGGHITPVLTVADALKARQPHIHLIYAIGKGDKLIDIPLKHPVIDRVITIRAGKFRRYHGEGWQQVFDLPTLIKNIRDFFYVFIGFWQSLWQLWRLRPDIIFIKGGFVGVPIGLAAALLHIPYVTHDSDALPGLANRIISRWAQVHAVGQPAELYSYPPHKTQYVGVPVGEGYRLLSNTEQQHLRQSLGILDNSPVLCITGGGLGAEKINQAMVLLAPKLFTKYNDLWILHQAGRSHEEQVRQAYSQRLSDSQLQRVKVIGFAPDLYRYSGVADVIVCRAGATTLADFAAQQKACIVIPNPVLTGGHQLKNIEPLRKAHAVVVVDEQTLLKGASELYESISKLFDNREGRLALAKTFHEQSVTDASDKLAELLMTTITKQKS